jgi:hypothetical protein
VVECKNRTLVESARCMISFVKLPNSFWAEVVSIANYIQNRVPTKCPSWNIHSRRRMDKEKTLHVSFKNHWV